MPTIITQPTDQTVDEGQDATFTVVAEVDTGPTDEYWDSVDLYWDADTNVIDRSPAGRTLTPTNLAYLPAPTTPFGQGGDFNGTTHVAVSETSNEFNYLHNGTIPWTLEMRVTLDTLAGQHLFDTGGPSSGGYGFTFVFSNVYGFRILVANGVVGYACDLRGGLTGVAINTEYVMTATYDGTTVRLWRDGVLEAGVAMGAASATNHSDLVWIGESNTYGGGALARIDEVRLTKGVARYDGLTEPVNSTEPFPTQGPVVVDDNWADVTLLLGQDQANASQTFTDESQSANTVTVIGNTQYSTADPKFNLTAIEFDATGDYLSVPLATTTGTTWNTDLTFDMWVNVDTLASTQWLMGSRVNDGSDNSGCILSVSTAGTATLSGFYGNVTFAAVSATGPIGAVSVNTWAFVRVIREAGTWTVAVDGVAGTPVVENANVNHINGGTALQFGADFLPEAITSPSFYNGQMEQIRITNGTARDITELPTEAFPAQGQAAVDERWNDVELLVLGEDGLVDASDVGRTVATFGTAPTTGFAQAGSYGDTVIDFTNNGGLTVESITLGTAFSVEWRMYADVLTGSNKYLFDLRGAFNITVYFNTLGQLYLQTTSGNDQPTNAGTVTAATWHDMELSYDGSTIRLFVDGVQQRSVASASTNIASERLNFGGWFDGLTSYYDGKMENIRVTTGGARNTTGYTPGTSLFPTQGPATLSYQWEEDTGPVDSDWASVELYRRFDGDTADQTTTGTWTDTGLTFEAAPAGFGSRSVHTGTAYAVSNHTLTDVNAAFTAEVTIRVSNTSTQPIMSFGDYVTNADRAMVYLTSNQVHYVQSDGAGATIYDFSHPTVLSLATEYQIALENDGAGTMSLYVDGVRATNAHTTFTGTEFPTSIGRGRLSGATTYFAGTMDEFRLTEGVARYTGNYTPAITQFPIPADEWEAIPAEVSSDLVITTVLADNGRNFRCGVSD